MRATGAATRRAAIALAAAIAILGACGETRRPIGEECLRDEDCLSSVCAARTCVSAPPLVTGGGEPVADETPRIPDAGPADADAGASDARSEDR
jgi:hypothetical protein